MAELAVRLGGASSCDRRGRVVFWDSFQAGLGAWALVSLGGVDLIQMVGNPCASPGGAVEMHMGVPIDQVCSLQRWSGARRLGRTGVEVRFCHDVSLAQLQVAVNSSDGVTQLYGQMNIDIGAGTLSYRNSVGGATEFEHALALHVDPTLFHTAKLVIDASRGEYVRFLLDSIEYDLRGIGCHPIVPMLAPSEYCFFLAGNIPGEETYLYLDNVIMTREDE